MSGDVQRMFREIRTAFGGLDILVNNAGITLKKPFEECDESDWDRVMNANLKSVFLCCRQALLAVASRRRHPEHFVRPRPDDDLQFLRLCRQQGGHGIPDPESGDRIGRAAHPGQRALRLGWIQVERDHIDKTDPDYDAICDRIPVHRPGEVADVVPTAIYLCSDDAAFITGQVIVMDGGHETMLNTVYAKGYATDGART